MVSAQPHIWSHTPTEHPDVLLSMNSDNSLSELLTQNPGQSSGKVKACQLQKDSRLWSFYWCEDVLILAPFPGRLPIAGSFSLRQTPFPPYMIPDNGPTLCFPAKEGADPCSKQWEPVHLQALSQHPAGCSSPLTTWSRTASGPSNTTILLPSKALDYAKPFFFTSVSF